MKPLFKISVNECNNKASSQLQITPLEVKADGTFVFDGYEVRQTIRQAADSPVKQQFNTIRNTGNAPLTVNRLSSAFIEGVAVDFHRHDVRMHYCNFCWQGEGQWVSRTPYEMGIYPVSYHAVGRAGKSICGIGSWSTERYYPILIVEDKTIGRSWFFEHEGGFSWEIEIGSQGKPESLELTVDVNALNENIGGAFVTLQPNEEFETSTALYGVVDGDWEAAVWALLRHKRANSQLLPEPLFCFNDYMNCLWSNPSAERSIPLIDAAADIGAEVFCIDAGWYIRRPGTSVGDWIEDDDRFPGMGLRGIIQYIAQKGMKPGVWLELETYYRDAAIRHLAPDAVLVRRNNAVEAGCGYLNFECEAVCRYLADRIRHLYGMGVRYIKNDYNHTLGIGCDNYGKSNGYGLIRNARAFLRFIDEIQAELPDLIIENCGSGALRCDNGTLKHFALQSTSDQERYYNNPSILWGMMRLMPPEKCGIWAFPYPLTYNHRLDDYEKVFTDDYLRQQADGCETIYNMACTFFGIPYLSGHIEQCDEFNRQLIKKAACVYKEDRSFVCKALPISLYPQQAMFTQGYSVLALKTDEKMRIGVFKYGNADKELTLDVSHFVNSDSAMKEIYPAIDATETATLADGKLIFRTDREITAHVYEITL